MRQMLSVGALVVLFAACVASAEPPRGQSARQAGWTLAIESPWMTLEAERIEAPRPVTLQTPYSDCRVGSCAATADESGANCNAPQAGPQIIDMMMSPPRGYSPSADFGSRVQAVAEWAAAVDGSAPLPAFPHPMYFPPQPFAVYTPLCPPSPGSQASPESVLPPPPPSFGAPAAAYCPPIYTAAVPNPIAHSQPYQPSIAAGFYSHPMAYPAPPTCWQCAGCEQTGCGQTGCGCPSCNGSNCVCTAAAGYHPQVIYPATQCGATGGSCCGDCTDRVDHILEAVHHLEAAGMTEDADRLRHQCDAEMKAVVERLKKAESEIARLRESSNEKTNRSTLSIQPASARKMVTVSFQLLELNRTKCDEDGIEISENAGDLVDRLDSLKEKGVLEVISRPQIMTTSGETGVLFVGQSIPVLANASDPGTIDLCDVGTTIEVRPVIRESGKIRLQVRCNVNTYNVGHAVQPDGVMTPTIEGRHIQSTLEVASGKTAILTGILKKRNEPQVVEHVQREQLASGGRQERIVQEEYAVPRETQLLFLMRPEIVGEDGCNSTKCADGNCAEAIDLIKSAIAEAKAASMQPACCDEGPVCKCASSCCAAKNACGESHTLDQAKTIFALPSIEQPFQAHMIHIDPASLEIPVNSADRPAPDLSFQFDWQSSDGLKSAVPAWFTQPVVTPVESESEVKSFR